MNIYAVSFMKTRNRKSYLQLESGIILHSCFVLMSAGLYSAFVEDVAGCTGEKPDIR